MALIENGILKEVSNEEIIDGTYVIPSDVLVIGPECFTMNLKLIKIVIPSNVVAIGKKAFYGCPNLLEVGMTNSILVIGEYSFYNCTELIKLFVIQEEADNEEKFYCTKSEFVEMFGFFNSSYNDDSEVKKWEEYYLSNSKELDAIPNKDWFTYQNLDKKYKFISGIYRSAFENVPFKIFEVPNKIIGLGYNSVHGMAVTNDAIIKSSNLRVFDYLSFVNYHNMSTDSRDLINEAKKKRNAAIFGDTEPVEEVVIKKLQSNSFLGKFKALLPRRVEEPSLPIIEKVVEPKRVEPIERKKSIEELELIITNGIKSLELSSDTSKIAESFQSRIDDFKDKKIASQKGMNLYSYQAYWGDLIFLSEDIKAALTLFKLKKLKAIIDEEGNLDSESIEKCIKDLMILKQNLENLKMRLNPEQLKILLDEYFYILYEYIKKEMLINSTNTLFENINDMDKLNLYQYFLRDIKLNLPSYLNDIAGENDFNIDNLKLYIKALKKRTLSSKLNIQTRSFPLNTILIKIDPITYEPKEDTLPEIKKENTLVKI